MYLKKLTLFGFKSFADKTELVFEPGVTAIVGPNGCGKSNISDSIKWVLGEQSAKELRGSRMEDIIFNGTDDTHPVNLAEVSLVLSNENRSLPVDYDEVIITRRGFRTGESEYFLNKTQVRLRDIMTMLAGTGIGVSSYSIAEQGKMDRVLTAKPEDRREIFEEASGITIYKTKKKEAMVKLEHTENNLLRIADIINEVKRQINSIERQAQKAQRYRQEFEKLKELDVRFSLYEYNKVKDDENRIKLDNESLKQNEAHLSLELNIQQDELRQQREKANSLDAKVSDIRLKSSEISSTVDKNENMIKINKERIEELSRRSQTLAREIDEATKRILQTKEKIKTVEYEFNLINDEKQNRQVHVTETEKHLNAIVAVVKECEKTIADNKLAIMDNMASQSKLKNDLNKIAASLIATSSRHRRLNIEKENLTKEKESTETAFKEIEASYQSQREALDTVLKELKSFKSTYEQLLANSKEKSQVIEKLKQRFASASSKLELLKELKDKKEGFSEGVKAYLEFIDKNPRPKEAFVGVVAYIIHPRSGFVKAAECALGEKSQIIIVKTKEARIEALQYLKQNKKGRAQFIALDELNKASTNTSDFKSPAVIGKLSDYIEIESGCEAVLRYILKDTYLAESIDNLPSLQGPEVRLVTNEGDLACGVIVSGGQSEKEEYTGIIGRQGRIKELSKEVDALSKDISSYESEYSQMVQRIEQIQKDLKTLEERSKNEEIRLRTKEAEKTKVGEEKEKITREFDVVSLELDELKEEEEGLKAREQDVKEQVLKLEAGYNGLESSTNEGQIKISQASSEKEKVIVTLAELRTKMSLVNEKFSAQETAFNMLKGSLGDEETGIEDRKNQHSEAQAKSHSLKEEIERLNEENRLLVNQGEIVSAELTKLQDERKTLISLIDEIDGKIRDKQKKLDELRNNISTFHININELNYKTAGIKERIFNAYRVDIDSEKPIFSGSEDWQKIKEEVEQLRIKIEAMGPVNLVAIEEHKELQERYDFLTNQQQDLLDAKESLHTAINKINRTTRKMFIDTFEQIKVAFKDYFRLLFGGGAAELFLIDQADILESGIEIVVRPPGKKLQSISLLSGGEKALTSVALLFALFKVKPIPFCVLDEMDAPLDEANIDRFSRLLQEFVKTTQFIIITHNKKTIAISDVMYGITMEKSGISKIVSVKFAESQKAVQKKNEGVSKEDKSQELNVQQPEVSQEEVSEPTKSDV